MGSKADQGLLPSTCKNWSMTRKMSLGVQSVVMPGAVIRVVACPDVCGTQERLQDECRSHIHISLVQAGNQCGHPTLHDRCRLSLPALQVSIYVLKHYHSTSDAAPL